MGVELCLTISNDLGELARVNDSATLLLEGSGVAAKKVYLTCLALEELLSNVIRHAYEAPGKHEISVCLRLEKGQVLLQVEDDGREFDPLSAPAIDLDVPLERRRVGGLGIHLLRKVASEIRYARAGDRNRLDVRIPAAS